MLSIARTLALRSSVILLTVGAIAGCSARGGARNGESWITSRYDHLVLMIRKKVINVLHTLDTGLVSPGLSEITSGLRIAITSGLWLLLFRFLLTSSSELQDDSLDDLRRRDFRCFLCFDLDLFLRLRRSSLLRLLLLLLLFFFSLLTSTSSSSSKVLE